MNVGYIRINDSVYITEDDGLSYFLRWKDNLEKILIYNNRKETLERIIKEERLLLNMTKQNLKLLRFASRLLFLSLGIVLMLIALSYNFAALAELKLIMMPFVLGLSGGFIFNKIQIKENVKELYGLENKIAIAEEENQKNNEELRELNKNSNESNLSVVDSETRFVRLEDFSYLYEINSKLDSAYNAGVKYKTKIKTLKRC